jgi:Family of unknown function (DUF5330)
MRLLLRMAFWLTVILVLLPSGGSQPAPKDNVNAVDAVSAAKATVGDVGSFCQRQPDACVVGSQAAVAIGHRAQAGARMLYQYLSEYLTSRGAGAVVGVEGKGNGRLLPQPSQHTLSPADLGPPWRGPQPHQGPRHDASGSPPSS